MLSSVPPLPIVMVSPEIPAAWLEALEGEVEIHPLTPAPQAMDARVAGILSILTVAIDEAFLARFPALQVISSMAVGVDNIDLGGCARRGVRVGNTPGVLTDATADVAMMLTLSVARNLPRAAMDAREGRWGPWSPVGWLGTELRGKSFGVIGLGAIGAATARRARAFGLDILYTGPSRKPVEAEFNATYLDLEALLGAADIVSLHCPLTPETRHLMDAEALRHMRSTAILINTSRGDVVDQNALLRALDEGWIAGAGLDVTSPEPLPAHHPLFERSNCLISPHIGRATRATRRAMATLAGENLLAALAGGVMPSEIVCAGDN